MQSISPAMMRGLDGLPQDQVAVILAQRIGVKPSQVSDYLMKGPQVQRHEPMVTCRTEWTGAHEGKSSGGIQARQVLADERRARVLELFKIGLDRKAIAKMTNLNIATIRAYIREGTKR